jgi:hypothetical protein
VLLCTRKGHAGVVFVTAFLAFNKNVSCDFLEDPWDFFLVAALWTNSSDSQISQHLCG